MTVVQANTQAGVIRGVEEGAALAFRNIPYARPPVGGLRFRPPEPPEPWKGVRDCREFGPQCPQPPDGANTGNEEFISEDSLTINVWTPATDDGRRPVMVWLHGGSLYVWGARDSDIDGTSLAAREDVVVVTVQYRLGVFGFLHLADIAGPGYEQSGNHGFLDQVAALEWVRDNIAAFGGDPDNVTIFGNSSGADSVSTLMCMPQARGLFHRAIHQSGCPTLCAQPERAADVAGKFMELAGVGAVEELRAMSMEALLEAQDRLLEEGAADFVFVPVVDGVTLAQTTLETFTLGEQAHVPLMIGSNLDELRLFSAMWEMRLAEVKPNSLRECWRGLFNDEEWEGIERAYFQGRSGVEYEDSLIRLLGDVVLRMPELRLAEHMMKTAPTYVYLWSYRSTADGYKAAHMTEIPFIFGTLETPYAIRRVGADPDRHALGDVVQHTWAEFARTGNPNNQKLPPWPAYTLPGRTTMILDLESHLEDDPLAEERMAWDSVAFDGHSPTLDEIATLDLAPE